MTKSPKPEQREPKLVDASYLHIPSPSEVQEAKSPRDTEPERILYQMIMEVTRDRDIRGDVDMSGSSEIRDGNLTRKEQRAAAYRQGYLDALRDAREAIHEAGAH